MQKREPGERRVTEAFAPFRPMRERGPGEVPGPGSADQTVNENIAGAKI